MSHLPLTIERPSERGVDANASRERSGSCTHFAY
jgi:hypothetical protein